MVAQCLVSLVQSQSVLPKAVTCDSTSAFEFHMIKYLQLQVIFHTSTCNTPNAMEDTRLPSEDDYHSASDEDFNPDRPPAQHDSTASSSSDSDSEHVAPAPKRKRREREPAAETDDANFENSGDEATIQSGRRGKKKRKTAGALKGGVDSDSDQGGEGGLVKTRAQRRAEGKERKPLRETGKASVDVESLWTQMSGAPGPSEDPSRSEGGDQAESGGPKHNLGSDPPSLKEPSHHPSENTVTALDAAKSQSTPTGEATVTIKRKYDFAGQTMEEERVVPANSAEARLYQAAQEQQHEAPPKPGLRRPTRKKAGFPVPDAGGAFSSSSPAVTTKGTKLNTLQKSKMDWAAHVDREGLGEELDEHSRAKGGYLGRMDFLGRMDAKRERDLRNKGNS